KERRPERRLQCNREFPRHQYLSLPCMTDHRSEVRHSVDISTEQFSVCGDAYSADIADQGVSAETSLTAGAVPRWPGRRARGACAPLGCPVLKTAAMCSHA